MRVVVVAVGSRGDVAPLQALAQRLAGAGHESVLVTHAALVPGDTEPDTGTGAATDADSHVDTHAAGGGPGARVEVVGVAGDPALLLQGPAARALRRADVRGLNRARGEFAGFLAAVADPLDRLLAAGGVDVLVASVFATAAVDVARRHGVPVVRVQLWPERQDLGGPMPALPYAWLLPGPARRAARWSLRRAEPLLAGFDGWWSRGRLVIRPHYRAGFTTTDLGTLHAYSPAVAGPDVPPADGTHVVTGWWTTQRRDGSGLTARTRALLDRQGPPWVVAGFGSMTHGTDAAGLVRVLGEVARRRRVRVLLQLPSGAGDGVPAHDDAVADRPGVWVIGDEPHDVLFPRVAAVVHHGGSGTTAAVVRAGVPSVVVPHVADQFYWAHRLHRAGAASRPLPWARFGARPLAARLRVALDTPARLAADGLAEQVRHEPGLQAAVAFLEDVVAPR